MSANRGGDAPASPRWRLWAGFSGLFISLALVWYLVRDPSASHEVAYSVAYGWIRDGKVRSVELSREVMEGRLAAPEVVDGTSIRTFHSALPAQDDTLMPLLHGHDVELHVLEEAGGLGRFVASLFPWLLVIGGWWWWSARMRGASFGGGLPAPLRHHARRFDRGVTSATKFADVAGMITAKRDLEEIVTYLKEPERIAALGAKVPRGVLLVGPPGTGKTLVARAVAGEADVPFFSITGSEFIELFVGVGAARVRELFADAKAAAPSIVFIDELDAVGRVRGAGIGGGHDEREQTLDQLLAEMDGFDRRDQVIVLAATNRPDVLDPALLRPGRFDRRVVIDLPELGARREILAVHVRDKPLAPTVDLDEIAAMTPGFSGADLANLINEAALHALREHHALIDAGDVSAAYDKIVLGEPRDARLSADERQRVATHEAGHAVMAWASPNVEPPRRVSILPRGMALGATEQVTKDRHLTTRRELEARLSVLLAGHAAELLVLGEASTGAEHDLRAAMRLAEDMVAHYGMSDALGPVYYEHHEHDAFLGHRIATDGGPSEATVNAIESAARDLITQARAAATAMLERHRGTLDRLVTHLLAHETLERDALTSVLGPRPACVRAAVAA